MRIDLSQIVRTVGMCQNYEVNEPAYVDDDLVCTKPLVGKVSITNSGRLLLVRGNLSTSVEMECARCLAPVETDIDAEIEEQYTLADVRHATRHDVTKQIVQDDENEVPEGLMDGLVMNLDVILRQSTILAMPMALVCREDCKGLCPSCGADWNNSNCQCGEHRESHAFAALKEMFENDSKDQ